MTVLTREALESSPLADLHEIAKELSLDGFRKLRKADLVDLIIERQGGEAEAEADAPAAEEEAAPARKRSRGTRGGRGRRKAEEEGTTDEDAGSDEPEAEEDEAPAPRKRSRSRKPKAAEDEQAAEAPEPSEDRVADGVVELLGNGSGFLRVAGAGEPSDDDVYISAAQVRRCELVDGDQVTGPVRAPRRSERYPSLVRIDTINGRPADEVAEGTPFDDLPAAHPSERLALGTDDVTLEAIDRLAPFGKGSRVVLAGGAHSGKTEALRRIAAALAGQEGLEVSLVLAGVRPEETSHWAVEPVAALPLGASSEARAQAVERAVDTAKRLAARGGHAVVLIDSLDGLDGRQARKALGAARDIADGGSLTVVATAAAPLGGETTVLTFDAALARAGKFPALDVAQSGSLRPDLLVGADGLDALFAARAEG